MKNQAEKNQENLNIQTDEKTVVRGGESSLAFREKKEKEIREKIERANKVWKDTDYLIEFGIMNEGYISIRCIGTNMTQTFMNWINEHFGSSNTLVSVRDNKVLFHVTVIIN